MEITNIFFSHEYNVQKEKYPQNEIKKLDDYKKGDLERLEKIIENERELERYNTSYFYMPGDQKKRLDSIIDENKKLKERTSKVVLKEEQKLEQLQSNIRKIEDKLVNPPIIDFRLGDIYVKKIGLIESLSYTFPDSGTWEIDPEIGLLPKFIEVSLSIKFILRISKEQFED